MVIASSGALVEWSKGLRAAPNNLTGTTQQDEPPNSSFDLHRVLEQLSSLSSLADAASPRIEHGRSSNCIV